MNAKALLVSLGAMLAAASMPAHAGLLTYQDVTFTSSWKGNVLTLEIDAAKRTGDWTKATGLKALELKGIGNYTSVSVSAAPKSAGAWKMSGDELGAKGCSGDSNGQAGSRLCFYGAQMALADNMVFSFAFDGLEVKPVDPHVKVQFVNARGAKVGSLLSQTLPASPATAGATTPAAAPVPAPSTTPVPAAPATPATPAAPVVAAPAVTPTPTTTPAPVPAAATMPPASTAGTVASNETAPATSAPAATPTQSTQPIALPASLTPPTGLPATLPASLPVSASQEPAAPAIGTAPANAAPAAKPAEVPEPHGIALLLAGLGVMGVTLRRRSKA